MLCRNRRSKQFSHRCIAAVLTHLARQRRSTSKSLNFGSLGERRVDQPDTGAGEQEAGPRVVDGDRGPVVTGAAGHLEEVGNADLQQIVGADPEGLALLPNATAGVNVVVRWMKVLVT